MTSHFHLAVRISLHLASLGLLVQYVILRSDLWQELKWPLGSIAAQVSFSKAGPYLIVPWHILALHYGQSSAGIPFSAGKHNTQAHPCPCAVVQACHAAVAAIWLTQDQEHTVQYCSPGQLDHMHKVTRVLTFNKVHCTHAMLCQFGTQCLSGVTHWSSVLPDPAYISLLQMRSAVVMEIEPPSRT